jgi:putative tryptophan/tyrosine transport system substrate-binding protein
MMDRRACLAGLVAVGVGVGTAQAQQGARKTIGYLSGARSEAFADTFAEVKKALAAAGFVEGQNLTIEQRWAEGDYTRLPALAAELVAQKVDVIIASGGDLAGRAAKTATATIPIVCTSGDDPVTTGLVQSLARPGGNITGVGLMTVELHGKRLELLHEVIPDAKVVGLLANPASPQTERVKASLAIAAKARGLELVVAEAVDEAAIQSAFVELAARKVQGVLSQSDPFFIGRYEQIVAAVARLNVPAVYDWRRAVELGGLMSYGTHQLGVYHQLGDYAAQVLKGTSPADLPVVQPTRFELALNLATMKSLNLTIPQSILLRTDKVID